MAKSAADIAAKWSRNVSAATQAYTQGVQAVQTSPMEQAAAHQDAYVAGVQAAAQSGKWAAGLRSVSLQQWKDKTAQLGAQRLASGAAAATPKMQAALQVILPAAQAISDQVKQMPNSTLEDRIARMLFAVRAMAQVRVKK